LATQSALPGNTLVGHVGLWANGVDGYAYQMYKNGQPVPGYSGNWPGSNAEYVVQNDDVGATFYFAIWASNNSGTGAPVNTNPVYILGSPTSDNTILQLVLGI